MKLYDYAFYLIGAYRKKGQLQEAAEVYDRLLKRVEQLQKGDLVILGSYLLPGGCKPIDVKIKMPITWIVLHREGTRLLLLSQYCLDWDFFDGSGPLFGPAPNTQWSRSSVRPWLNGEFFDSAFRDPEKAVILETQVETADNPEYKTKGGEATRDRLFLLSAEEVDTYLKDTDFATAEIFFGDSPMDDSLTAELSMETYEWWLRTPGGEQNCVAVVCRDGSVDLYGMDSDADEVGIRPAMWIDVQCLA